MAVTEIHGHCDDRFEPVRQAFAENFAIEGEELGASFALSLEGEMVVDIWAGYAHRDKSALWQRDTIVPVMSTSKNVCSLCGLLLIDRGLIDLDEPVATYWPEFAAAGKEALPVRYLFTHASGLAGWDLDIDITWLYDWDRAVAQLASQEPWWEPGTQSGYHVHTYGFLIGELVRRTTGKTIGQFFRDEIGDALDADFYIGVPDKDLHRVGGAGFHAESHENSEPGTEMYERANGRLADTLFKDFYKREWLQAEIPALNGIANARGLARIGSILAMSGEVGGKKFLGAETAKFPYQEQIYTNDLMMGEPVRWGLGFAICSKEFPMHFPNAFQWGGYGGSVLAMCPDNKASWCYVPNLFHMFEFKNERWKRLDDAVGACIKRVNG